MSIRILSMLAVLAVPTSLMVACGAEVPASPTYFDDVQPILRANCVRCHGAEPSDPKIATFRLDRYVQGDDATFDAWDYAQASGDEPAPIIRVAVDQESPAMPPDYALTDRQREILARWVEHGAPKGTRANRAPQIELVAPAEIGTADQGVELVVRAWDDDLDGLVVQLWAHDLAQTGEDVPLGPVLGAGRRELALDTGTLASNHDFEIYAILDDGFSDDPAANRTRATVIPRLSVDHGARGTAPTVHLVTPDGGDTAIGTLAIAWSASDPDPGDSLTVDLALLAVAPDTSTSVARVIATGLPNSGSFEWAIPPELPTTDALGSPQPYKVRITVTDALGEPPNVRTDESDAPFTIAQPTTTSLTWDDVRPILQTYCIECHGQPARSGALEYFRVDKYDTSDPVPPTTTDQGVYETRNLIYQRMVAAANMPPNAAPQPSPAERQIVGEWIQGGAPRGGGPVDARPTFTWLAPSATDTTPPVMLQWSAADAEGLSAGRIEYARVNGNPGSGCSATNTSNVTWTVIADPQASAMLGGATMWSDGLAWTPPSSPSGYYCLRGVVTDAANQVTSVLNPHGVR